jgi:outer membrane protein OmpA-like peptidoglycan-associated protein
MSSRPLQIDLPHSERDSAANYIPWVIVVACAAALIILISQLVRHIPDALQSQASIVVQNSDYPQVSVKADGRDLNVSGSINTGDSTTALFAALEQIRGVRVVNDHLETVNPADLEVQTSQGFYNALQKIDITSVKFQTGSVAFTPESEPALEALVDLLRNYPQQRIRIEGHTDNTGPDSVNLRVSQDRAGAVANYLSARGIAMERLIVKGYGASQPIDDNETEPGRSRNRRIEISHVF